MIYSQIQNYLDQVSDPDTRQIFDRAVDLFTLFGYEDYLDEWDRLIGENSEQAASDIVDALRNSLTKMVVELLALHGVSLNEQALLSERLAVLEALQRLPNLEDRESMRQALAAQEASPEIFANLVSMCGALAVEQVLALIDEVDDSLLVRLRELDSESTLTHIDEVPEGVERVLADYARYAMVFANDERWCDTFTSHAAGMCQPFVNYANLYAGTQQAKDMEVDEELAWRRVCVNLIGCACLSEEGPVNAAAMAKPYLERTCPDLDKLTRLYTKLTQLLLEFNRAQT